MTYEKLYGMLVHDHGEVKGMFKETMKKRTLPCFQKLKKN